MKRDKCYDKLYVVPSDKRVVQSRAEHDLLEIINNQTETVRLKPKPMQSLSVYLSMLRYVWIV